MWLQIGVGMKQYVKIYCCGDCIQYNWRKHKCNLGAHEEGKPSDSFYQDCPIGLHEEEILPSVEPERKKGKWIPVEREIVNGRCSVCGYESHLYENDVYDENYCPNCGAKLDWSDDE